MIGIGVVLINSISWMIYVFGAFLFFTAIKMLFEKDKGGEKEVKPNKLLSYLKLSKSIDGEKFFTVENGVKMLTPLFAALIVIELTDVLFALDSIPAILAVTTDPFIVFSSNIFAILGLRSMYFFLAIMLEKFHYLKYSVIVILIFVSIKLLVMHYIQFPEWISLLVIGVSLATGIFVSMKISVKKDVSEQANADKDL
jgi:tellurite resistance protein TerC